MKKILLGLLTSLCIPTSFAECTYAFDAKQSQVDQWNAKPGWLALFNKADISAQKVWGTVSPDIVGKHTPTQVVSSSQLMNYMLSDSLFSFNSIIKDKLVNGKNIIAYEVVIDVDDIKNIALAENQENWIVGFANIIGSSDQQKEFWIKLGYARLKQDGSSQDKHLVGLTLTNGNASDQAAIFLPFPVDGKIRVGFYSNQITKQTGFVANGVNYGYLKFISDQPITQIGFQFVMDPVQNLPTTAIGKKVSFQLITDHSKLKFNYPTGTTDICGNAL